MPTRRGPLACAQAVLRRLGLGRMHEGGHLARGNLRFLEIHEARIAHVLLECFDVDHFHGRCLAYESEQREDESIGDIALAQAGRGGNQKALRFEQVEKPSQRRAAVVDQVQDVVGADDIKAGILKREGVCNRVVIGDVGDAFFSRLTLRDSDHLARNIDRMHLVDMRSQLQGERTCAAADIQHSIRGAEECLGRFELCMIGLQVRNGLLGVPLGELVPESFALY